MSNDGRRIGTSPKPYAMELRLDAARDLVVQTGQWVAEIALASGFASTSRCTRALRAEYGISSGVRRARVT